jgi:glycosyltransferase involved in cell wall biosynthesis
VGGGDRVVMDVMTRLDRSRFRPILIAPASGPVIEWGHANSVQTVIVAAGDWAGRVALGRRAAVLAALILRMRVRIVHASAPTCYRAAGLAGTITRIARVCHLGFPPADGELAWSFQFGPDAVIACYDGQARELDSEIHQIRPPCRVLSIPNGIDTRMYSPLAVKLARWRFGGHHVVIIVGHLSEVKGYPTFLRAARRILDAVDGCQFLALGGETIAPGYRSYLDGLASDLGISERVHFLGWRSEVAEILASADVMVLPSAAEGLPLAVLEAMSCGLPVVATSVGGTPEAVVNGSTGFLIAPGDDIALATRVIRLLQDSELRARLGGAARQRATSVFSLDRVVSQLIDLYGELLGD